MLLIKCPIQKLWGNEKRDSFNFRYIEIQGKNTGALESGEKVECIKSQREDNFILSVDFFPIVFASHSVFFLNFVAQVFVPIHSLYKSRVSTEQSMFIFLSFKTSALCKNM